MATYPLANGLQGQQQGFQSAFCSGGLGIGGGALNLQRHEGYESNNKDLYQIDKLSFLQALRQEVDNWIKS